MITVSREVQLLLRDFQEEWTRAKEMLEHGGDAVLLAQMMHSAGETLTTAAAEIALEARKARRAKPSPTPPATKEA